MKLPEFTRSTTLRWTLVVASIFAAFVVALLGFVYLKTKNDLTMRSDRIVASRVKAGLLKRLSPEIVGDDRHYFGGLARIARLRDGGKVKITPVRWAVRFQPAIGNPHLTWHRSQQEITSGL